MASTLPFALTLSRLGGGLLVLATLVGVPSFFVVVLLQHVSAALLAVGLVAVGVSRWRARVEGAWVAEPLTPTPEPTG